MKLIKDTPSLHIIYLNEITHVTNLVIDYFTMFFNRSQIKIYVNPYTTERSKSLSLISTDLIENLLLKSDDILVSQHDYIIVIIASIDLNKISRETFNLASHNSIVFDNLDFCKNKNWFLGSIKAMLKVLIPAYKILDLNDFKNTVKYISQPCDNLSQLVWYSQRIGLNVYDA